jgi:two-component system NtrC family sensor kinase
MGQKLLQAKKRVGIGIRLAIMLAVLVIVSTGLFTAVSFITQRREVRNMFVHSSLNMTRSLERILRFSMLENRRGEIESAIERIASEEDILSASLITHAGERVYSSGPFPASRVVLEDRPCSGCHVGPDTPPLERLTADADVRVFDEQKVAELFLPVYNAPTCSVAACHAHSPDESLLGILQMSISYGKMDEVLSTSHAHLMALSIGMAAAVSVLVFVLTRRWVTQPVKDLLSGTRRVADGDLGHTIPVGEAELGALAHEFNRMQNRLRSSQRQLITAEKLASVGKLAASVAHEINNPLTGILTFAEDLADSSPPEDPRMQDFEIIKREAIRCREIVRDLLDFSRQEEPKLRPIDINDVLSHTIKFISKQAVFQNVEIATELQNNLPPVVADPIQLEQVVLGLLINASEAMPDGGHITVSSASVAKTQEVEISIADTGSGISKENLQRIFEPFFSTKGGKSMGIGLAVSWNIITQHGGRLEADSQPGEGTIFRIILPWEKPAMTAAKISL